MQVNSADQSVHYTGIDSTRKKVLKCNIWSLTHAKTVYKRYGILELVFYGVNYFVIYACVANTRPNKKEVT